MKEAMFWEPLKAKAVRCLLCNHFCEIMEGRRGICGTRINNDGTLYSLVYGRPVASCPDPIEKKPLFHFLPGTFSFSVATAGCNFSCSFCQNYSISLRDSVKKDVSIKPGVSPSKIVSSALSSGCSSISYTYTEPAVFFEYAYDIAREGASAGLKNVFVTNGYMSAEALRLFSPFLDAANIDLKGGEDFYKELCGAERQPVVDSIRLMNELGIWVELTTLLIPGYNDSEETLRELAFIIKDISPSIPWHISRFFPVYKMSGHYPTPEESLINAREIGLSSGLKYVYVGNMPRYGGEDTVCYSCNSVVLKRQGYEVAENRMKNGRCGACGAEIDGVFSP